MDAESRLFEMPLEIPLQIATSYNLELLIVIEVNRIHAAIAPTKFLL